MPNPIKRTTGAETLALKKGNFYFGTGDVGKGPSETTGYYQGVNVPTGGYTVYQYNENQPGGLSYGTIANDSDLIVFTNGISGETFTTVAQCLTYFDGQTDRIIFNRDYEPIVTDGLVLNVDAGFDASYPEAGTTWRDISPSGNNGTLINSPGYYANGGGGIVFDGTDDYVVFSQVPVLTNQLTMECWYYLNAIQSQSQNRLISNFDYYVIIMESNTSLSFYMGSHGGYLYSTGNNFLNSWNHIVATYDGSSRAIYINGVLKTTSNASGNINNGNILNIGAFQNQSVYTFNGRMSQARIYNKGLTASQVLQNYNAMKDRFAFIFTVDTTKTGVSTSTQFKLPLVSSGTINFVIEWGDGTSDTITTFNQAQTTHTFSSGGVYEIKIRGLLRGWQFANGGDRLKMGEIKNWGCLDISVDNGFHGCTNMTCVATDAPIITSTSLSNYFRTCGSFNGAIGNWDVSNVTSLFAIFYLSGSFKSPLNNWNVSKVQNFGALFVGTAYNSPLNNWDTSSATSMGEMFNVAGSFNQDISNFNTSKVTDMGYMFRGCPFNKSISDWDVSKVQNMNNMFSSSSFNQNIGSWNVSAVTSFASMFQSSSFNNGGSADINNWTIRTASAVNMSDMFQQSSFNQNIGNWNVSGVTNMSGMFYFASSFNNGGSDSINNWNVSNLTTMLRMFRGSSFNQPLSGWNVSNVTNMQETFMQTPFNQPIGNWDMSKVKTTSRMFQSNGGFNQDISNWNVSGVTIMSVMFYSSSSFDQDIGSWNVSNVISFVDFLNAKTSLNYSASNLDSIYNGWSQLTLKPNLTANFGSIKYNSSAQTGKDILINTYGWTITDGGTV